ncbi:MAG: ATP synthase gamma chain, sodium ion specific [Candidatus Marinimicrobia bacterium]|nr:ATP synthase gamma chain, sodium ion specific [Candidatus Neomarinimicrobiota bacterium]
MATLREVKNRIGSVKNIRQVTRAMKMVAAAKLQKAQQAIEQARPYAFKINNVLRQLLPQIDRSINPLLEVREQKHIGLVIVTADRGLCGAFNSRIIRQAEQEIEKYDPEQIKLICIGKKGLNYFRKRDYDIIGEYTEFFKDLTFSNATSIVDVVTELYISHGLDRVDVLYNEFKNVIQQGVVVEQFLPLVVQDEDEIEDLDEFMFEPNQEDIVNSLVPQHLNVQMWRMLLESNAAERGARRTAMDNATSNAEDMIEDLQRQYNKARQAAITKEISEIVGGAEAMKED